MQLSLHPSALKGENMPNRYNGGSGYGNQPDHSANHKHIPNTDNENTQYLAPNTDSENTAEIRRILDSVDAGRAPQPQAYPQQSQPYPNPNSGGGYPQQGAYPQGQPYPNSNSGGGYPQQHGAYPQGQPYPNPNSGGGYPQQPGSYNGRYAQNPQRPQPAGGYYNNSQPRQPVQNTQPPYNRSAQNGTQRRHPAGGAPQGRNPQQRRPAPQQVVQNNDPAPKKKKKKKRSLLSKIIIRVLCPILSLLVLIFGVYSCTSLSLINNLNKVETGSRNHVAGAMSASYVTNVLLIGTDGRDVNDRGRSDTMILLSINNSADTITITSFMRDSYVTIPGHGQDKLNHSYSYGGAELLMDTIELNYNIRIDDYVMINFNSFASIVDAVSGIEVEISEAEAQEINTILMAEVNELMGDPVDSDLLDGGGKVKLNGKQALAYARIRYVGNADFERTERQREVITKVAGKLKSFSFSMISNIIDEAVPQVSTNMSTWEMYWLSLKLPFVLGYDFKQIQIPADGTYSSTTTSSGGSALAFDAQANQSILKEEIFSE